MVCTVGEIELCLPGYCRMHAGLISHCHEKHDVVEIAMNIMTFLVEMKKGYLDRLLLQNDLDLG